MISVCMATYNGGKYIKEQVDSILCQLDSGDEIIVSDDGSTDDTLSILKAYNDDRIKILSHKGDKTGLNSSELVGANFENALKYAQGDYIFISDQDDIWVEDKVKLMCEALKENTVVCSNAYIFQNDDTTDIIRKIYNDRRPQKNYTLRRGKYFGCCTAFRKDMLKYVLPFPRKMLLYDHWIGLISELKGSSVFIDKPLIYHRIHKTNTSENIKFSLTYKIFYRIRLLTQLYLRVLGLI